VIRPLPLILLMSKTGSVKRVLGCRGRRRFDLREVDAFGAGAGYVGEGEPVEWFVRIDAGAINESRV
jgi:hypothetical protein